VWQHLNQSPAAAIDYDSILLNPVTNPNHLTPKPPNKATVAESMLHRESAQGHTTRNTVMCKL
jgi:hypothetical protein